MREPSAANNIYLFVPTAERLVVFIGLAVSHYLFIAYIYWQNLVVDLLRNLCNIPNPYNCIQRLCKFSKPSNSLKLLFQYIKSTLKGTLFSFARYSEKDPLLTQHQYFLHRENKTKTNRIKTTLPLSNPYGHPELQNGWQSGLPFSSCPRVISNAAHDFTTSNRTVLNHLSSSLNFPLSLSSAMCQIREKHQILHNFKRSHLNTWNEPVVQTYLTPDSSRYRA